MLGTNPTTWITSLNDNGINKPTKNKSSKRVKTTQLYYLQETHFEYKHTGILKVKEWEIYTMLALIKKKARIVILTSDKANFRTGNIIRDKEVYYMKINTSIFKKQ